MKLKDLKADYEDRSRKASDVARQLAFAGIAIVWVFRVSGTTFLPNDLLLPLALFALVLILDVLQYSWGGFVYWIAYRNKERSLRADQTVPDAEAVDFTLPEWLANVGWMLLTTKLVVIVGGYSVLTWGLFGRVVSSAPPP